MSRLEREIEFHEQRFADGEGARPQDHFYVAIGQAVDLHYRKVTDALRSGGAALEIGCGVGWLTERLMTERTFKSYGIDVSEAAVRAADARLANLVPRPDFRVMDANNLEFEDSTFDVVYGSGVIHHLELPRAFAETRRVLKPGGRLICMEPLGTNPLIEWYRRRTPQDRSPDETPLTVAHMRDLHREFDHVDTDFFGFTSLAAVPLRHLPAVQRMVLSVGSSVDRGLLKLPAAWRLAWYVVIDARVGKAT